MRKSGLAFHCHHDILMEYVYDYNERVDFIKEYKPPEEVGLRLRLFKMIPYDKVPKKGLDAYLKAFAAYDKAANALDKAYGALQKEINSFEKAKDAYPKKRKAHDKAWHAHLKACSAYFKAEYACARAEDACLKARDAYLRQNEKALLKLHSELCPNCPWDGKTIFPDGR